MEPQKPRHNPVSVNLCALCGAAYPRDELVIEPGKKRKLICQTCFTKRKDLGLYALPR